MRAQFVRAYMNIRTTNWRQAMNNIRREVILLVIFYLEINTVQIAVNDVGVLIGRIVKVSYVIRMLRMSLLRTGYPVYASVHVEAHRSWNPLGFEQTRKTRQKIAPVGLERRDVDDGRGATTYGRKKPYVRGCVTVSRFEQKFWSSRSGASESDGQ